MHLIELSSYFLILVTIVVVLNLNDRIMKNKIAIDQLALLLEKLVDTLNGKRKS